MISLLLLIVTTIQLADSQVIGIDFGTQFWKAALISPGKNFVIVENSRSERKTPNGISFQDGIRLFEKEAVSKKSRYPKSTFVDLNKLLPLLDNNSAEISFSPQYHRINNSLVFSYPQENTIQLQQLLGMIFKNIKLHASKQAGTQIKDCVITVPSNWGLNARNVITNSAHIADLSVLSIIKENTAAALNYAMTRSDSEAFNVVLFNLGSYNLQVSVFQFSGYLDKNRNKTIQSLRVLSHQHSNLISGYVVDELIANILARNFQSKHKKDVKSNERAWIKLMNKAADVKETLSANKEVSVYIEGLLDGIDFHTSILRTEIQEAPAFEEAITTIQKALRAAQLTKRDISSVQLIGGASRIPKIVNRITEFFAPAEVGTHINGDEAMALGAVLHAANLSVTFRVKEIHLYDSWDFPIKLQIVQHGSQRIVIEQTLFKEQEGLWLRRQLTLNQTNQDLVIRLSNDQELLRQYATTNLNGWKNLLKQDEELTRPVVLQLSFVLSSVNIVELKEAFINVYRNQTTIKQVVQYVKERIIYNKTDNNTQESTQQTLNDSTKTQEETVPQSPTQNINTNQEADETQTEQQNATTNQTQQVANKTEQNTNKTEQKKKKLPKYKTVTVRKNITQYKQKLHRFTVRFVNPTNSYHKYNRTELSELSKVIRDFEKYQNGLKERSKLKNELESRLYDLRRSYDEKFMTTFSKPFELQNLKSVVESQLNWLDQNSFTATKQDFEQHLSNVFQAYRPIWNRTTQYQQRPNVINQTIEYLSLVYDKTIQLNNTNPWVRERAEALLSKVNDTVGWYKAKVQEQQKMPFNQDPVYYNYEPTKRAEKLRDQYYLIKMIPRPRPSVKVQEKKQGGEGQL